MKRENVGGEYQHLIHGLTQDKCLINMKHHHSLVHREEFSSLQR